MHSEQRAAACPMTNTILYFDCFSGAGGDMILGALADAGAPVEALAEDLASLPCGPIHLRTEQVKRCGLSATKVRIEIPDDPSPVRGLSQVREIIESSTLSARVQQTAVRVFTRLAEAEAAVHGLSVEKVHFHELGGLDTIADVVGAACALERLGVSDIFFSTLRLGGGTVSSAHGVLPVPAPATVKLVAGCRCELGPAEFELLTPTAAAILTTLGEQRPPPPFRLQTVGYGAGDRDDPDRPNVLRVLVGCAEPQPTADSVWVLEANLDDTTPEVLGHALDRLLAAGALDAWLSPIQMKKSRPGVMLGAIAEDAMLGRVEDVFFRETATLGVRRHRVERAKLQRRTCSVETPYGTVRVKVGSRNGETLSVSPEFEDCRRVALERGVPLQQVMEQARRAFREKDAPQ